jgi:hypothetical protein
MIWPVSAYEVYFLRHCQLYNLAGRVSSCLWHGRSTSDSSRVVIFYFVLFCWIGTKSTSIEAIYWPFIPALDDRWWFWSNQWNEWFAGKQKYLEKTHTIAALSTTSTI